MGRGRARGTRTCLWQRRLASAWRDRHLLGPRGHGPLPPRSRGAQTPTRLVPGGWDPHPLGPGGRDPSTPRSRGHSLSREHSSTASTAGPVSSFPPRLSRLMAAFSSCCRPLRCSGPKPGVTGVLVRSARATGGQGEGSSRSGPLTRGRRRVEIGCKAMDVAADRDALISDPEGTENGHGVVGRRGRPIQGPR